MARNLTTLEIAALQTQLANAQSISDVTRIARVACGYRFVPLAQTRVVYTESDCAWFRRPAHEVGQ